MFPEEDYKKIPKKILRKVIPKVRFDKKSDTFKWANGDSLKVVSIENQKFLWNGKPVKNVRLDFGNEGNLYSFLYAIPKAFAASDVPKGCKMVSRAIPDRSTLWGKLYYGPKAESRFAWTSSKHMMVTRFDKFLISGLEKGCYEKAKDIAGQIRKTTKQKVSAFSCLDAPKGAFTINVGGDTFRRLPFNGMVQYKSAKDTDWSVTLKTSGKGPVSVTWTTTDHRAKTITDLTCKSSAPDFKVHAKTFDPIKGLSEMVHDTRFCQICPENQYADKILTELNGKHKADQGSDSRS